VGGRNLKPITKIFLKLPSFSQWKQIFNVLKRGEKIALLSFFILAVGSLIFLASNFYITNTKVVPAFGGTYIEGMVGQPRFINPIYGETNDIDRTLLSLVFSGLMTYDKQGNIVKDLVDNYTISTDGKTYTFTLKNNIFWHDGRPLTSDDVLFTIKTIQNSDYKSPLRANWIDVDAQKLSDRSFTFTLKQPYSSFLENCTVKILPQHIWENISPENFTLSSYNLQPVGSGPFEFTGLNQTNTGFISTLHLQSNRRYYSKPSFIAQLDVAFFEKTDDVIKAANAGVINGFTVGTLDKNTPNIQKEITQGWPKQSTFNEYSFSLPRYFAVFLNNQKSSIFADVNVRKALTYAVNKKELTQKISDETQSKVVNVDSPILPDFYGYAPPTNAYEFNIDTAKTLLDKAGFKDNGQGQREKTINKKPSFQFKSYLKVGSKGPEVTQLQGCLTRLDSSFQDLLSNETNGTYGKGTEAAVTAFQKKYLPSQKPTGETGTSTRQELNLLCAGPTQNVQPLKFTLVTINQPQLVEVATMLKNYWQNVGISVDIQAISITDLKPIIKNRSYDALLYGETLGIQPDLYPFWYSSQKQDPGLNLSSYENKDVDALLKDARQTLDANQKEQDLEKLQTIIINDAPAIFLYNPDYTYWVLQHVKGIDTTKIADPAKRFVNITNWFVDTKRVWK
jgi:peptide/nickel transport system substrate-binding protein